MLFLAFPLTLTFFFFNDPATTEIYTLSLHDALPIRPREEVAPVVAKAQVAPPIETLPGRSEEHTSELQSPCNLVCRLLLEKKKKKNFSISFIKTKKKI